MTLNESEASDIMLGLLAVFVLASLDYTWFRWKQCDPRR